MKIHQATIHDIQDQVLGLLSSSSMTLEEILKTKEVHVDNGLVNQPQLQKALSDLENEYQKVEDLEMVIAVVGTMKAGKSTTINAIVGHEVLPNRNYPMTALPTVVSHVQGKKEPILNFDNAAPIVELSKEVAKCIENLSIEEKERKQFLNNKEVEGLKQELFEKSELSIPTHCEGQDEIFSFLKKLNDLMRLAKELDIEPPYDAYSLINDLPTIEVEFQHLKDHVEGNTGRLSILDTPGPNEFGQSEKLRAVFRDQLQKSSAVLLVVDYTQMNSEAGGAVREEVNKIKDSLGDRFYVMLNKFDAKKKNDQGKEETIKFFCEQLMSGQVDEENVFAVSAYRAFLANKAQFELENSDNLDVKEDWVAEFAEIAFGADWDEEDFEEPQEVLQKASRMWKKSSFQDPLTQVVSEASANAATLSLTSALDSTESISNALSSSLNNFNVSLLESVEKLKDVITGIESDRDAVSGIKKDITSEVVKVSNVLEKDIDRAVSECVSETNKALSELLEKGRVTQDESKKLKNKDDQNTNKSSLFGAFHNFLNFNKNDQLEAALTGSRDIIRYQEDEEADAKALINSLNKALSDVQKASFISMQKHLDGLVSETEKQVNQSLHDLLKDTIDKAREKLDGTELTLDIDLESIDISNNAQHGSLGVGSLISKETERETRSRVKKTKWSKLKNFLNDDWGREEYTVSFDVLVINIPDVKRNAEQAVKSALSGMKESSISYVKNDVVGILNGKVTEIETYLERYRKTLLAGIETQKKSQHEKELIIGKLGEFKRSLKEIEENVEDCSEALGQVVHGSDT